MQKIDRGRAERIKGDLIMLKAFRLLARTVFLSVACFISSSEAAFEPRASKAERTDVAKSHVQDRDHRAGDAAVCRERREGQMSRQVD